MEILGWNLNCGWGRKKGKDKSGHPRKYNSHSFETLSRIRGLGQVIFQPQH
jgi:hypothetical protein